LAQELLNERVMPDKQPERFLALIDRLIKEGKQVAQDDFVENNLVQAAFLAKALSFCPHEAFRERYEALLYATDIHLDEHFYTGEEFAHFGNAHRGTAVHLAFLLRALFAPDYALDYTLLNQATVLFEDYDQIFGHYGALKHLLNLFLKIKDISANGFSVPALKSLLGQDALQSLLDKLSEQAGQLMEFRPPKSKMNALIPMVASCLGKGSDLADCMEIISENRVADREYVQDVYNEFCNERPGMKYLQKKIEEHLDHAWDEAIKVVKSSPRSLMGLARKTIAVGVDKRLHVVQQWLELTETALKASDTERLQALRGELLTEMDSVLPALRESDVEDASVLLYLLTNLHGLLGGDWNADNRGLADLYRSGFFHIDGSGIPMLRQELRVVPFFEPWRGMLRHIAAPACSLRDVLSKIPEKNSHHYDNWGIAKAITRYLRQHGLDAGNFGIIAADIKAAESAAKAESEKFKWYLEQAFAYGHISEVTREDIVAFLDMHMDTFFEASDFGCYRAFLNALRQYVEEEKAHRLEEIRRDICARKEKNSNPALNDILCKAELKLDSRERNFVVAEEYINRFDEGNTAQDFDISIDSTPLQEFVQGEMFREILEECKRNQGSKLSSPRIRAFMERKYDQRGLTAQYRRSGFSLLDNLPNGGEQFVNATNTQRLLSELGFAVERVEQPRWKMSRGVQREVFLARAYVKREPRNRSDYLHPVDIMGTKLSSPIEVIFLFGQVNPEDIIQRVNGLELNQTAIVFLNGTLDQADRRRMADSFHKNMSGQNPFLLIDWPLLLFLALQEQSKRFPMLLGCCLPYTSSFNPFVLSGSVSDEVFTGRKQELNQIADPQGAVFVYGGRQLGKSALLERACNLGHRPERGEYAVYLVAIDCQAEEDLARLISCKIDEAGLMLPNCDALKPLCDELAVLHRKGVWSKLLLLMDETDYVLSHFHHTQFNPLEILKRETRNAFKFVFAGLHNVCRAASDSNHVFHKLGPALPIKPLTAAESYRLLVWPLRFLGFQVDLSDIEHILVNTSFYPGIVHYVGYKLVENLMTRYGNYYSTRHNPPYNISSQLLGSIMSNDALNEQINTKFRATLEVDPRYFMLARCIAYLYLANPDEKKEGYSIDSILEYAQLLDISALASLSGMDASLLLREMMEMGILVEPSESRFRLRQQRFLMAIGNTTDKLEKDICEWEEANTHG
jgi:hypothetical protein